MKKNISLLIIIFINNLYFIIILCNEVKTRAIRESFLLLNSPAAQQVHLLIFILFKINIL